MEVPISHFCEEICIKHSEIMDIALMRYPIAACALHYRIAALQLNVLASAVIFMSVGCSCRLPHCYTLVGLGLRLRFVYCEVEFIFGWGRIQ